MSGVLCVFSLALIAAVSGIDFGGCPTVKTQEKVDINKYLGYWYEIFVFPTRFEKGGCTRAHYTLKPDGHIEVFNRGIDHGKNNTVTGDAYRPNDDEQGKLLVRFAAGTPYGNYWVIDTDYETYSLVYSCSSVVNVFHIEMAWILSREMTLDEQVAQRLKDKLSGFGVDVSKFVATNQTGCPK